MTSAVGTTLAASGNSARGDATISADASATLTPRRGGGVFIVDFHRAGNSATYRTFGWSGQEETHVWSVQGSSGLRLPAPAEVTPLVLEVDFNICSGRQIPTSAVLRVFVNGQVAGSVRATGWTRLRCDIPANQVRPNSPIELRFEHPCFVSPNFMNPGSDNRALGLCFYAVRHYPPWLQPAVDALSPRPPDSSLLHTAVSGPSLLAELIKPAIYHFDLAESGRDLLLDGWLHDGQGYAWADARICTLEIPAPAQPGQYLARFNLCPLYIRSFMELQWITILLAGAVLGQFSTGTEVSLAIPLPPELYDTGSVLRFGFAIPNGLPMHQFHPEQAPNFLSFLLKSIAIEAIPPRYAEVALLRDDDVSDPPPIALSNRFIEETIDELPDAVSGSLGTEIAEILRHFESLGDNCAFGLAQRKGGCETLGLLRFASTPLKSLLIALDDEFASASVKADIALQLQEENAGEYSLFVDRYGIRWHTDEFVSESDEATVFAQQTMRLSYLRRKFYETLRAGRKIFTISRANPRKHPIPLRYTGERRVWEQEPEPLRLAEVLPVFFSLNRYGTNTLLYLNRCSQNRRSGTVELIAPGLMRGYVDNFVITPEVSDRDHAAWLRVAVNAWLLDQGPNAAFRGKIAP